MTRESRESFSSEELLMIVDFESSLVPTGIVFSIGQPLLLEIRRNDDRVRELGRCFSHNAFRGCISRAIS